MKFKTTSLIHLCPQLLESSS